MLYTITKSHPYQEPVDLEWESLSGSPLNEYFTKSNTLHHQAFGWAPDWVMEFAQKNFLTFAVSVMKQPPGNFIPNHLDQYHYFRQQNPGRGDGDPVRFCIFLEDWQPGHYFEINGQPCIKWKRGQYCELDSKMWHRSANAGDNPKLTAQITGFLRPEFSRPTND